ncbi:MAG: hypothetical protein Q7J48_18925, partial [Nocardioides sp.]|nr:hypothetical protein [Nocardioides sp.]
MLIAEDLLLLLLDDEKGTVRASSHLSAALGGADPEEDTHKRRITSRVSERALERTDRHTTRR